MVAPAVRQNKYKLLDCKLLCVPNRSSEWLEARWHLSPALGTHCRETCTIKEPFFIIKLQSQKSTLASRLIKILSLCLHQALFLDTFLVAFRTCLNNVTEDPRYSRLLADFSSVGGNVILTIKRSFDFLVFF